ncbi:MAG: hypothetical protein J6U05_05970 [Neisseriaceae bacterium]|nr:hypothetical protein [Neisseriaceae bacterium]
MLSNKKQKIFRIILGTLLVPFCGDICILWFFTENIFFFINKLDIFLLSFAAAFLCVSIPTLLVRLWIEFYIQSFATRLAIACLFGLLLAVLLTKLMPIGVWFAASLIATISTELIIALHWRCFQAA